MSYWFIFGAFILLSYSVSKRMKRKFKKYSKVPSPNGLSGKDIVLRMLKDHGIYDVNVKPTKGTLTDHYNPTNKTINLSEAVYYGQNISAIAIAAHECGHAVQHAQAYYWLTLRSKLVPIVGFSSQWVQWVLLGGILLINIFPQLLLIGIILFALTTLFSVITLPVEIDASKRALAWLNHTNITNNTSHSQAKDALKSAAYTYVVAALGSLATLAYYVMIYLGADD